MWPESILALFNLNIRALEDTIKNFQRDTSQQFLTPKSQRKKSIGSCPIRTWKERHFQKAINPQIPTQSSPLTV